MLRAKIADLRDIQCAIFDEMNNTTVNAKEQRETIDALLQQLQKAIEEKYFSKTQEIIEIKGMLAIQEQQLA